MSAPITDNPSATPASAARESHRGKALPALDQSALESLTALYGPPTVLRRDDAVVRTFLTGSPRQHVLLVGKHATGAAVPDRTALPRLQNMLDLLRSVGVEPGLLVAGQGVRRRAPLPDRPDLEIALAHVASHSGACVYVDRPATVSFDMEVAQTVCAQVRGAGGRVMLVGAVGSPHPVDENEALLETTLRMSRLRADESQRRAQDGIRRLWLEPGKGHPRLPLFGTVRDADGFLVEDPATAGVVAWIYEQFAAETSVPAISKALQARGITLSPIQIRRILRDPLYITGESQARMGDQWYPLRRIEWTQPVSEELAEAVKRRTEVVRAAWR